MAIKVCSREGFQQDKANRINKAFKVLGAPFVYDCSTLKCRDSNTGRLKQRVTWRRLGCNSCVPDITPVRWTNEEEFGKWLKRNFDGSLNQFLKTPQRYANSLIDKKKAKEEKEKKAKEEKEKKAAEAKKAKSTKKAQKSDTKKTKTTAKPKGNEGDKKGTKGAQSAHKKTAFYLIGLYDKNGDLIYEYKFQMADDSSNIESLSTDIDAKLKKYPKTKYVAESIPPGKSLQRVYDVDADLWEEPTVEIYNFFKKHKKLPIPTKDTNYNIIKLYLNLIYEVAFYDKSGKRIHQYKQKCIKEFFDKDCSISFQRDVVNKLENFPDAYHVTISGAQNELEYIIFVKDKRIEEPSQEKYDYFKKHKTLPPKKAKKVEPKKSEPKPAPKATSKPKGPALTEDEKKAIEAQNDIKELKKLFGG